KPTAARSRQPQQQLAAHAQNGWLLLGPIHEGDSAPAHPRNLRRRVGPPRAGAFSMSAEVERTEALKCATPRSADFASPEDLYPWRTVLRGREEGAGIEGFPCKGGGRDGTADWFPLAGCSTEMQAGPRLRAGPVRVWFPWRPRDARRRGPGHCTGASGK